MVRRKAGGGLAQNEAERGLVDAIIEAFKPFAARGVTQSELARAAGVTECQTSGVLSGRRPLTATVLERLEYALNVTIDRGDVQIQPGRGARVFGPPKRLAMPEGEATVEVRDRRCGQNRLHCFDPDDEWPGEVQRPEPLEPGTPAATGLAVERLRATFAEMLACSAIEELADRAALGLRGAIQLMGQAARAGAIAAAEVDGYALAVLRAEHLPRETRRAASAWLDSRPVNCWAERLTEIRVALGLRSGQEG